MSLWRRVSHPTVPTQVLGPSSSSNSRCVAQSTGSGAEQTVSHGQKASCSELVSVFVCLYMATRSDCPSPRYHRQNQKAPGFLFSSFISLCCVSLWSQATLIVGSVLGLASPALNLKPVGCFPIRRCSVPGMWEDGMMSVPP